MSGHSVLYLFLATELDPLGIIIGKTTKRSCRGKNLKKTSPETSLKKV